MKKAPVVTGVALAASYGERVEGVAVALDAVGPSPFAAFGLCAVISAVTAIQSDALASVDAAVRPASIELWLRDGSDGGTGPQWRHRGSVRRR